MTEDVAPFNDNVVLSITNSQITLTAIKPK